MTSSSMMNHKGSKTVPVLRINDVSERPDGGAAGVDRVPMQDR